MSKEEVVAAMKERGLNVGMKDKVPFLFSTIEEDRDRFVSALSEIGYCSSYGYSVDEDTETGGEMSILERGECAADAPVF